MDLVINHTSSEHPWFKAARDPASPYHDWYSWAEPTPTCTRSAPPVRRPGTPRRRPALPRHLHRRNAGPELRQPGRAPGDDRDRPVLAEAGRRRFPPRRRPAHLLRTSRSQRNDPRCWRRTSHGGRSSAWHRHGEPGTPTWSARSPRKPAEAGAVVQARSARCSTFRWQTQLIESARSRASRRTARTARSHHARLPRGHRQVRRGRAVPVQPRPGTGDEPAARQSAADAHCRGDAADLARPALHLLRRRAWHARRETRPRPARADALVSRSRRARTKPAGRHSARATAPTSPVQASRPIRTRCWRAIAN